MWCLREPCFGQLKDGDSPGPHQQKPGANSIFSLKPSPFSSAAINIPALNKFLLFPQAVPSRIPTRLYGPLLPQTFDLVLGQSSLTSKEIIIHPEIINSDYKKKNSNYDVISDSMAIQKGGQNCPITYFTFLLTPLRMYRQADSAVQIKNNPYGHHWYLNVPNQI